MANTKSALKNIRKSNKLQEHNRHVRSTLKTLAKKVNAAEGDEASKAAAAYISALDKAAKRGIIHANKASRHKSALASKVAKA
ncbi:30S ribosomal protein S20 [Rubellicoccus peritrichatus]|uniref:Small ribosomal subunit protein bS20 n=1 Tax=Rubellicoccus peritrichatus TaxID=3080537 RepID=A0AAQ3L9Z5_9BACT|nr:30S ribosomal protein S20 [Puniceicoccus sp. CR14]WOO41412.1 30S ribosomal protein S20 [Puniceicoccus sp. CR14]